MSRCHQSRARHAARIRVRVRVRVRARVRARVTVRGRANLLGAAVVGYLVVVHVERERGGVVGVRQIFDLDEVAVMIVVFGEGDLEVGPVVVRAPGQVQG